MSFLQFSAINAIPNFLNVFPPSREKYHKNFLKNNTFYQNLSQKMLDDMKHFLNYVHIESSNRMHLFHVPV